jgi:pimeloyl-ACP methyl ester carboxylesterase
MSKTLAQLPIVLLPGMDGTGILLRKLEAVLSASRPTIVLDYPADAGLGYAELTRIARGRLPLQRFVILGESFSGPIAIELAARDPRIAGVVLAVSFARCPVPRGLGYLAPYADLNWFPDWALAAALFGSTGQPETRRELLTVVRSLPRAVVRNRAAEVCRVDKTNYLRSLTCPLLCLHGRQDRLIGRHVVRQLVEIQPTCRVEWFDASHMLLATHAAEIGAVINQFCNAVEDMNRIQPLPPAV